MNYIVIAAITAVLGGVLYWALRSPAVWTAITQALAGAVKNTVLKDILPTITKRMTPEKEKEWRDLHLRNADKDEIAAFERKWRAIEKSRK